MSFQRLSERLQGKSRPPESSWKVIPQSRTSGRETPITEFVCYVFVAQAASVCHWNWTAMGDGQRPTEGDSRLRGTQEPVRQATDAWAPRSWTQRADGLAASAAAVTLVWCGHTDGRLWPGGRQRSVPTAGVEVVRRWCRTAVSCNSPGDTRWTPERASWWHGIHGQRSDYWSELA